MSGIALYYHNRDGKRVEKKFGVEVYKQASDAGVSLRQLLRQQCPDFDPSYGDVLDQMATNACLHDGAKGYGRALTIEDLSKMSVEDGMRRPDGSDTSLGARLLYPQIILETLNAAALRDDGSDILAIWESMIAVSRNIDGSLAAQPIIDVTAPEKSRSRPIAQLAEPATMVSITTGQRQYAIPTNSIGLTISHEAMKSTTIDLVNTVMSAQARGDKIARVGEQLRAMVNGDLDVGIAALPVTKISTFDNSITTDGVITKKAYIKWLLSRRNIANITKVLTDVDSAMAMDEAFLPKVTGTDSSKIVTPWGGLNLGLSQPQVVPFDTDVFGAGIIVGMDPRYAIQRFTNISASYEAIQEYVMRKATSFRVDYGEMATRLYDEAWSVVSLEA